MEIEEKGQERKAALAMIFAFSLLAAFVIYVIYSNEQTRLQKEEKLKTTTPYTKEWCNLKSHTNQQYFSCLDQIREKEINELKQKLEEKNVSP